MRWKSTPIVLFVLCMIAPGAVGCARSVDAPGLDSDGGSIRIEDAWVRPAAEGENSAGYLRIANDGADADRLLDVRWPGADVVELHETTMDGDMAQMRPVEGGLEIQAGESLELAPMGRHIMLMDLEESLAEGDTITMTLEFDLAGERTVAADVGIGP